MRKDLDVCESEGEKDHYVGSLISRFFDTGLDFLWNLVSQNPFSVRARCELKSFIALKDDLDEYDILRRAGRKMSTVAELKREVDIFVREEKKECGGGRKNSKKSEKDIDILVKKLHVAISLFLFKMQKNHSLHRDVTRSVILWNTYQTLANPEPPITRSKGIKRRRQE